MTFFLRCESRLRKYGNLEWNRVIDADIKKIVGIEKLYWFINSKLTASSFAKMQREVFLNEQQRVEESIFEEFDDLRDMEISEVHITRFRK